MAVELYCGELDVTTCDAKFITDVFAQAGHYVKMVRAHARQAAEGNGFAFIEFDDFDRAAAALSALHNKEIAHVHPPRRWKLGWASGGGMGGPARGGPEFSLFVGDLTPEVDDAQLMSFFRRRYPTMKTAKIVTDNHGESRGYGFVRFYEERDQQDALRIMQGAVGLGGKPIRVDIATPRRLDFERQPSGFGPRQGSRGHHADPMPAHAMYGAAPYGMYPAYPAWGAWPAPPPFMPQEPYHAGYHAAAAPTAFTAPAMAPVPSMPVNPVPSTEPTAPPPDPLEPLDVRAANAQYMAAREPLRDSVVFSTA